MKELDLFNGRVILMKQTVEEMLLCNPTVEEIGGVLRKYGLRFSDRSIENTALGLRIFKGIKVGVPFSFIIYGSTALGTAGSCLKVQEFQFWNGNTFCGSTFRPFGVSDLDLRCVSPEPQEVLTCLKSCENMPVFASNPVGIRVDDLSYAKREITDTSITSFYRRVLFLNNPIILNGRELVASLAELGYSRLTSHDFAYERELHESKLYFASILRDNAVVYISGEELSERFPGYYGSENLVLTNTERGKSFKVSFGQRESSLITIPVEGCEDIKRFTNVVLQHHEVPFSELRLLTSRDN